MPLTPLDLKQYASLMSRNPSGRIAEVTAMLPLLLCRSTSRGNENITLQCAGGFGPHVVGYCRVKCVALLRQSILIQDNNEFFHFGSLSRGFRHSARTSAILGHYDAAFTS